MDVITWMNKSWIYFDATFSGNEFGAILGLGELVLDIVPLSEDSWL